MDSFNTNLIHHYDSANIYGSTFAYTSYSLYIGHDWFVNSICIRFPVNIPQGSNIISAFLTLTPDLNYDKPLVPVKIKIYAQAIDNATRLTTFAGWDAAVRTSQYAAWDITNTISGSAITSPNISNVIAEVINRPGFTADNYVYLLLDENGTDSGSNLNYITFYSGRVNLTRLNLSINYASLVTVTFNVKIGFSFLHFLNNFESFFTSFLGLNSSYETRLLTDNFLLGIGFSNAVEIRALEDFFDSIIGFSQNLAVNYETPYLLSTTYGLSSDYESRKLTDFFITNHGLSSDFLRSAVYDRPFDEDYGLSSFADGFNFSRWFRENAYRAVPVYYFTLTGGDSGLEDIEIPISSFQCRSKLENPTYLNVVIPDYLSYATAISQRRAGDLKIDMAYRLSGIESIRETIIWTHFNGVTIDKGSSSQTVQLKGYRTVTNEPKTVTILEQPQSVSINEDGKFRFQFNTPDIYLQSGDTLKTNDYEIIVGSITYTISVDNQSMTVMEL